MNLPPSSQFHRYANDRNADPSRLFFTKAPLLAPSWVGVIWVTVFSLVRSTIAQDPLVLDRTTAFSDPASGRTSAVTYSSGNISDPPPLPQPRSSSGRPSFIPPPVPRKPAPAPDSAETSGTIVTQIELPTPPQTAEPLDIPNSSNTPPSSSRRNNDASFLNTASSSQPSAPARTMAAAPAPYPAQQTYQTIEAQRQPTVYRDASTPVTPTQPVLSQVTTVTEEIVDPGSPTIIYSKTQQAVPQAAPSAPEPPPPPNFGQLLRQRRFSEVEPYAIEAQDSALASAIGWAYYNSGKVQTAHHWFEKAIQWDESNNEAAYGIALSLYRMGRYEQAEEVAHWRSSQYPKMRKILGDVQSNRAVAAFKAKNYTGTREMYGTIRKFRSLTREEEIMLAWCSFHLGEKDRARTEFVRLYRAHPDKYTADGVYATYASSRNWNELEALAHERVGPLADLYHQYIGQKYYNQGLYRKAYAESPEINPSLQNIDSPVIGAELAGRSRSGTEGTSQLTQYEARLNGTIYANTAHRVDVNVGVMELNAGNLNPDTPIGKVPNSNPGNYRYTPKTQYSGLFDARIRYEYQDILTPYAELGITPTGASISPTFVGKLGLIGTEDWGSWNAEVYRESVKDSLLSYVGMRDPYSGSTWGRVTETGGRFSLFAQMQNDWNFYGSASAGIRAGKNIQNNAHVATALAVNKSLHLSGFEYFVVGPSLGLEFYDKNLSQFTFGQGGYFSPSYLVQGMISARFLTPQGGNSLLRGFAGIGIQTNNQDGTPYFPNKPDGRWHASTQSTGGALQLGIEGMYMLGSNWAIGGSLGLNVSPDYNDFSGRVTLQYFFEPRKGLFVQDFVAF